MTEQKKLRQAQNDVNIVGYLVEKNLEVKEFTNGTDGSKYKAMTGTLSVRTAENETHVVRFFAKEFKNDGSPNAQFTGLQTIINEHVSIADLKNSDNPEAKPDLINVFGGIELNEYYTGEALTSRQQVQGRFAGRVRENADHTPRAKFDIEGVVSKTIEEFDKNGEETGRVKVELLVPDFRGQITPLSFVVGENGADYARENFTSGTSVLAYGDIVNFREEKEKRIPMGFGEDKIEKTVTFHSEYLITGGTVYEEGMHDAKIFDVELIKAAGVERNKYLEQLKTRSQERNNNANTANRNTFGSNAPTTAQPKANAPKVDVSNLF